MNYLELKIRLKRHNSVVFLILLLLVFYWINYHSILTYPPKGIHFTRQTDCLSFVSNYYHFKVHFFEPEVYNLKSVHGKALCEFPILYFLTTCLYGIFGEHEFILRLITLVIVSSGFLALFKTVMLFVKSSFYAFALPFLILSSTVLLYYSTNFLPDASAFGLILIGWYFYFKSYFKIETKTSVIPFVFFTLGALLKVTYFINPIAAICGLVVVEWKKTKSLKSALSKHRFNVLFFLIAVLVIFSWNSYVIHYNSVNKDTYFLVDACPIWEMESKRIYEVWEYVSTYWYSKYYYQSTFHFFFIVLVLGLCCFRKYNLTLIVPSLFLVLGSCCYFFLFFAQFKDHDYYFIALIPGLVFLVLTSFSALEAQWSRFINHPVTKGVFLVLVCLSLNYGRNKLTERYTSSDHFAQIGSDLKGVKEKLNELGVPKQAKFITLVDETPNGALYFIGRKGWNLKEVSDNTIHQIDSLRGIGATHIITTVDLKLNYKKLWSDPKRMLGIYSLVE